MISYLPNIITVFRIGMVPLFILLMDEHHYLLALYVFILAGISDGLDGFIAKRFDAVSQMGAILDPIADKMLLVSAYIMLTLHGKIPFWLLLTVGFRDLLIIGGYLIYVSLHGAVQMKPSYLSKLNTVMQITLVVLVLAAVGYDLSASTLIRLLIYVVFATTVASGAHYVWIWLVRKDIAPSK